jgi:hypothetical protein
MKVKAVIVIQRSGQGAYCLGRFADSVRVADQYQRIAYTKVQLFGVDASGFMA